MSRLIDAKPGFLVSPKCKIARKGLAGGYSLRRLQVAGMDRYVDKPDKSRYSHVVEAGQYAMVGGGEGYKVVGMDIAWESSGYDDRWEDDGRSAVTGY